MRYSLVLTILLIMPSPTVAAQSVIRDTLSGHVQSVRTGLPIAAATVIITSSTTRQSASTTTDSSGAFSLTVTADEQGYLLFVRAAGFQEHRRSIPRNARSRSSTTRVDLAETTAAVLRPIQVQARRSRPSRAMGLDNGSSLPPGTPFAGAVDGLASPAAQASLLDLLNRASGIFDGGLGAYGLGAEHTLVTVNGVTSDAGVALPRGLAAAVQVSSSPGAFTGGFAGTNVNVVVPRGSSYHYSRAQLSLDGSAMVPPNSSSRNSSDLAATFVSLAGQGPMGGSRWRYNGAVDLSRSISEGFNWSESPADALSSFGVSVDSVSRLRSLLTSLGVPVGPESSEQQILGINGLVRFDRSAYDAPGSVRAREWSILASSRWNRADPSLSLSTAGSQGITSLNRHFQGSIRLSQYLGADGTILSESQLSVTSGHDALRPINHSPLGRTTIRSDFEDAQTVRALTFGGTGSGNASIDINRAEFRSLLLRSAERGVFDHARIDLIARVEKSKRARSDNVLGAVEYESLDDLAEGRVSRYSRSLSEDVQRPLNAAVGLSFSGSLWPTNRFQVSTGVRVDAESWSFRHQQRANSDALAGQRSVYDVGVSPRIALLFYPGLTLPGRRVASVVHRGAGWSYLQPPSSWSANVGRYRSTLHAAQLSAPGLQPISILDCTGVDVPPLGPAFWTNVDELPTECSDGGRGITSVPTGRFISGGFQPASTWLGSITRQQAIPILHWGLRMSAQKRITKEIASLVDLNLRPTAQFIDADGRSIFAMPNEIEQSTGLIPLHASRRDPTFGRLLESRSDGSSELSVLNIALSPPYAFQAKHRGTVLLEYWWQQGSQRVAASDAGQSSMSELDRVRVPVPRHQFRAQLGKQLGSFVMTGSLTFSSGQYFTPRVNRDLNGDGLSNDVAFVPSVDDRDADLVAELRTLAERVPDPIRRCIADQGDRLAAPYSCRGQWTMSSNIRVAFLKPLRWGDRNVELSMNVSNPVSAVDQLLHGKNVRGWGSPSMPDPILLYVQGFDPINQRFRYSVNPMFGQTRSMRGGLTSPFRLALNVSIDLADPIPVQQLRDLVSVRREGVRQPAPTITIEQRLRADLFINPYDAVALRRDSIGLESVQDDSLILAEDRYIRRVDTLFANAVRDLSQGLARSGNHRLVEKRELLAAALRELADDQWRLIGSVLRDTQVARLNEHSRDQIARTRR